MSNGVFASWFQLCASTAVHKASWVFCLHFALEFAKPESGASITHTCMTDGVFDSDGGVNYLALTGVHIHARFLCKKQ